MNAIKKLLPEQPPGLPPPPHIPAVGEQGRLLMPREAAALLRIDTKTLGRWARDGLIPTVRLPSGHRRFYESDVKELLTAVRADPALRARTQLGDENDETTIEN